MKEYLEFWKCVFPSSCWSSSKTKEIKPGWTIPCFLSVLQGKERLLFFEIPLLVLLVLSPLLFLIMEEDLLFLLLFFFLNWNKYVEMLKIG